MKMLGENLFPYEEEIKLHMFSVRMENGMWHTYLSMLYMSISRQGGYCYWAPFLSKFQISSPWGGGGGLRSHID